MVITAYFTEMNFKKCLEDVFREKHYISECTTLLRKKYLRKIPPCTFGRIWNGCKHKFSGFSPNFKNVQYLFVYTHLQMATASLKCTPCKIQFEKLASWPLLWERYIYREREREGKRERERERETSYRWHTNGANGIAQSAVASSTHVRSPGSRILFKTFCLRLANPSLERLLHEAPLHRASVQCVRRFVCSNAAFDVGFDVRSQPKLGAMGHWIPFSLRMPCWCYTFTSALHPLTRSSFD